MHNVTLSVIIPTLNEAASLPGLLSALQEQTFPPGEVIVADAGSRDGTAELAAAHGARVVPGGRPGPGRNAGARVATGELLLFLDADVLPGPRFIEGMLAEFERNHYGVATALIEPIGDQLSDRLVTESINLYLQVVQPFSPHAPGYCILVKRAIHERIGGFNESVKLAEDHDYVQRAAQIAEFGVLTSVRIAASMRRVEKEGLTRIALKYLWCEMHALAGKPIYSTPFEYEFGTFGKKPEPAPAGERQLRLIDIAQLREQLGRFENPLARLSTAGLSRLEQQLRYDFDPERLREFLRLNPGDTNVLSRYLHRRRALLRLSGRPLRETLAKLQTGQIRESIRLLDLERLRPKKK